MAERRDRFDSRYTHVHCFYRVLKLAIKAYSNLIQCVGPMLPVKRSSVRVLIDQKKLFAGSSVRTSWKKPGCWQDFSFLVDYLCKKNNKISDHFVKRYPQHWWPLAGIRNIHQDGVEDLFKKDWALCWTEVCEGFKRFKAFHPQVSQNSLTLQNWETSQRNSSQEISGVYADAKNSLFFVFRDTVWMKTDGTIWFWIQLNEIRQLPLLCHTSKNKYCNDKWLMSYLLGC